jgi:hypothetical protein
MAAKLKIENARFGLIWFSGFTGEDLNVIFYQNMPNLHNRYISAEGQISVNISHFNLLIRNHWANCNQTLVEWSLDGSLPKLCPVIRDLLSKYA